MIITYHFSYHGGFPAYEWDHFTLQNYITQCLTLGGRLACSVFAIISGYFLIRSDEKAPSLKEYYRRIFPLLVELTLYSWAILVCAWCFRLVPLRPTTVISALFPVIWGNWFVVYYALFFMLTPYVNRLLRSLDRRAFFHFLLGLFFAWSVVPTVFEIIWLSPHETGWSFGAFGFFAVMYTAGAFIRLHGAAYERWRKWQVPALAASLLFLPLSVAAFDALGVQSHDSAIIRGATYFVEYTRVPAVVCAVCLFLVFRRINFHSRFVNTLAASTLAIYIIHDNDILRQWLWKVVWPNASLADAGPVLFCLQAATKILAVYVCCAAVDRMRILLFRPLSGKIVNAVYDRMAGGVEKFLGRFA